MEPVSPLPTQGAVFFDPRDEGRFLRVSFHDPLGVFVLSLWKDHTCLGTFRLPADEAPRLVHAMVSALVEGDDAMSSTTPSSDARTISAVSEALQRRENA
ncbi:MAG: hypothetical protein LH645_09325 [Actinomycetia bacterium]|nr:hypothetical protein [Actinomycetes bacterium]